jgi:hypothetical protein
MGGLKSTLRFELRGGSKSAPQLDYMRYRRDAQHNAYDFSSVRKWMLFRLVRWKKP